MNKTMLEVSVYTTNHGNIAIQTPGGRPDWQIVVISPEQVEALIEWLREAKAELVGKNRE